MFFKQCTRASFRKSEQEWARARLLFHDSRRRPENLCISSFIWQFYVTHKHHFCAPLVFTESCFFVTCKLIKVEIELLCLYTLVWCVPSHSGKCPKPWKKIHVKDIKTQELFSRTTKSKPFMLVRNIHMNKFINGIKRVNFVKKGRKPGRRRTTDWLTRRPLSERFPLVWKWPPVLSMCSRVWIVQDGEEGG